MPFRVTWTFRQKHHGWSETLYTPGAANYAAALEKAELYAIRRLELCGGGPEIPRIRVSDSAIQGDSLISDKYYYTDITARPDRGILVKVDENQGLSDEPWTAAVVSLKSAETVVGRIFMRGLPDQYFSGAEGFSPPQDWMLKFKKWAALLVTDGWGPLVKPKGAKIDFFPITAITALQGQPLLVTAPGLLIPPGALISINGATFTNGTRLSGTFGVTPGALGTFTLDYVAKTSSIHNPNTGKARSVVPFVPPTVTAHVGQSTTRKSGRPFGSQVGWRKKAPAFR